MSIERKQIIKPYLILCEGKDAEGFLIQYLNSKALAQDQRFSSIIQVLNFGGNEELSTFLENLKNMDYFDQVTNLVVIRDAEKDYAKACREVCSAFKNCGFVSPEHSGKWVYDDTGLSIGFMLFPLNNDVGTLEDLCLQILSEANGESILSSIYAFLETMESSFGRSYHRKHKNILHTYFSSSEEYVTMPLGLASRVGAFNWSSNKMNPLKCFLTEGFSVQGDE